GGKLIEEVAGPRGVYCGGRLGAWGKLIEEVAGPRGVYCGGRLGAWGKLVAEVDGHVEYIPEVAWSVGEACC
ncbi:hypothetical protein C171_21359, partial [Paenibacillus sp. FSL H8-237]|uniref:hypothetical protein n=1 Tax=Paenibacillus sp. FSL H8-237 TaxID=1227350 RepID=UPI0003E25F2D